MIRKAIIPIAGSATRLLPISAAVPKALLPLADGAGTVRPVLHWIVAEAMSAGIADVTLIVGRPQRRLIERYLEAAGEMGELTGIEVRLIEQPVAVGLGQAVLMARQAADNEPVLVMLGHHVSRSARPGKSCAAQVLEAFNRLQTASAVIGVQPVDEKELPLVGAYAASRLATGLYLAKHLYEKPDAEMAPQLHIPQLPAGQYLAHAGLYAFSPEIFECLGELEPIARQQRSELGLSDAQQMLLELRPDAYMLLPIEGQAMDVGTAAVYARTLRQFAMKSQ